MLVLMSQAQAWYQELNELLEEPPLQQQLATLKESMAQQMAALREETAQQVASLKEHTAEQMASLRAETALQISSLKEELAQAKSTPAADAASWLESEMPPSRSGGAGRRLSSILPDPNTSHYEWPSHSVLHQFGDAQACLGGNGAFTMILPGKDDATYHTQEIYSRDRSKRFFHAPALTVFHAGNCSSTPTLHIELPLFSEDLTVSGTLSVGGTNIAAGLASATAAAAEASAAAQTASADAAAASTAASSSCSGRTDTSWTDLTFYSGHSQACTYPFEIANNLPRFKVICGIVYLAGVVCSAGGTAFSQAFYVVSGLPQVTNKPITFIAGGGCYGTCGGSGEAFALHKNSAGYLIFGSSTHTTITSVNLGGISYPLEIQ